MYYCNTNRISSIINALVGTSLNKYYIRYIWRQIKLFLSKNVILSFSFSISCSIQYFISVYTTVTIMQETIEYLYKSLDVGYGISNILFIDDGYIKREISNILHAYIRF